MTYRIIISSSRVTFGFDYHGSDPMFEAHRAIREGRAPDGIIRIKKSCQFQPV